MNYEELRRLATGANRSGHYTPLQKVVTPDVVLELIDRVAELAKSSGMFEDLAGTFQDQCVKAYEQIDALRTRLAEVERDAARFQWLRKMHDSTDAVTLWHVRGTGGQPIASGELDAAIDAAMEQA